MNNVHKENEPIKDNLLSVIGISTFIYLALGALGLSFAIAPGYASPIFPAAGYATAILLSTKMRAWPGIWAGSFILNFGNFWLQDNWNMANALIAIGIATGSTIQALVASWLVVRVLKNTWQLMEAERNILICLAIAGPLSCLISATIGVTILYLAGLVSAEYYIFSWWNWWSGDTLGVLVMLPLCLTYLYRHDALWRKRLTVLVIPMLIVLMLVGLAFFAVSNWESNQQKLAIKNHGETLEKLLEQRFIAHQEALSALRRMLEVTPDINYPQFEYFTRITLKDNPDIFALSINPYVTQTNRIDFERLMAHKTATDQFEIKEKNQQGQLIRSSEKNEYVVVGYIAPLEGNLRALGYDINSEPIRHDAIEQAINTQKQAVTMPIQLIQENTKRVGVLIVNPAFRQSTSSNQTNTKANLIGFAVEVIKVDEMVQIATKSASIKGLIFQLQDTLSANKATLYQSDAAINSFDSEYTWQKQLKMANRIWTLKVSPTADYLSQGHHWNSLAVGIVGLSLASMLQILLLITTGSNARVQRKVREQTAELFARGFALQDRNAELNTLFSLNPDGFVALSPNGIVKLVNPAFQAMTGIAADSIINKPAANLDAKLKLRCENPHEFPGISFYFNIADKNKPYHVLRLQTPVHTVLQIVGMQSESSNLSRILYLRNITREAEVDHMKSDFLAHAAHELRTPMASIFGFSEVLLTMDFDEPTRRELLDTIYNQTKWLVCIINELLDLSRIEARRGKDFNLEILEVSALLNEVVGNFKPPEGRALPVITNFAQHWVRADHSKLLQVLTNVLSNAYKYSSNGTEVCISVIDNDPADAEDTAMIGIGISDQGIGMTPQQLSRVCERFYRADTSGNIPGTGLGMSIVKEIVELHQGKISLESKEGIGTTVTIWLPNASNRRAEAIKPDEFKS
jgi:signal transduction histidine kinase/integral membrane sensor domain MASE1